MMTLIAVTLTFASGAMDVTSFTRLGNVFTSVMTGNIVLWGLAIARGSLTLAGHTAVAVGGYVVGVVGGTVVAYRFRAAGPAGAGTAEPGDESPARALPAHVTLALLAEFILLCGFTAGWEITGARPAGGAQLSLLAVAAAAMGVQSSSVRDMGLADVSTTYLTGTLTGLVSSLARPDKNTPHAARRFGVLAGLAAGATLAGLLVATAATAVPALPLAGLVTTLALACGLGGPGRLFPADEPDRGQLPP